MGEKLQIAAMNTPTAARALLWVLMAAYLVWFCVLFSLGAGAVHRISRWQAVFTGIAGFVVYQLFFLIFNR